MEGPPPKRTEENVLEGEHVQQLLDEEHADDERRVMRLLKYDAIEARRATDMRGRRRAMTEGERI